MEEKVVEDRRGRTLGILLAVFAMGAGAVALADAPKVADFKVKLTGVSVMSADGEKVGETGYMKGGPKAYLENLAEIRKSIASGKMP